MSTGARSDHYLRLLLWLLIPASFFNGFAGELRSVLLPELQQSFHVSIESIGLANIPIAAGGFVAFFVIRLADRIGRRPLLLVSLFGYATFTGLTATSSTVWTFALFQSLSQIFIGAEFALAVLLVSEEIEPEFRGRALGRLLIAAPIGVIFAAILQGTDLSWRSIYLIGAIPAVFIGFARRMVKESTIYTNAPRSSRDDTSLRALLVEPWRTRIVALGIVSFLEKIPVSAAVGWWVYHAKRDLHFSKILVSIDLTIAVGIGALGYIVCGKAIDRFGRKTTCVVYFVLACGFGNALFQTTSEADNLIFLVAAVFFGLGVSPALSALSAEAFPTRIRAQAGAVVGNGFAVTGELIGPALVGVLGARSGALGGLSGAVSVLTPLLILAIPILWIFVPETRATRLDDVGNDGGYAPHTVSGP